MTKRRTALILLFFLTFALTACFGNDKKSSPDSNIKKVSDNTPSKKEEEKDRTSSKEAASKKEDPSNKDSLSDNKLPDKEVKKASDISDKSISDNSIGDTSVSDNSVSDNSISDNKLPLSIKEAEKHIKLTALDTGYDVFRPVKGEGRNYRKYGPSMILNEDGSMDAWFSTPADGSKEYDWISHRHSEDGINWSDERIVLSPTPGSLDNLSVCDPDAFYYDGYYYLGYTSTTYTTHKGLGNSVFLARSKSPDGPYEKWNGKGFGGEPAPLVYYDGLWLGWGAGEPSFVIVDNTIYVYTTMDSYTANYNRVRTTEVRTADIRDENWPAKLEYKGIAAVRTDHEETDYKYVDCDSMDVVYLEEYNKFLAVCTNDRFTKNSSILYFESNNGINFQRVSELNTNIICGANNCGIMGDKAGHIKKDDPILLGYAYSGTSSSWGIWATRFVYLSLEALDEVDKSDEANANIKTSLKYDSRDPNDTTIMISVDKFVNYQRLGDKPFYLNYYLYDTNYSRHWISPVNINFSDYDTDVIRVSEGYVYPVSEGSTCATIEYNGHYRKVRFSVLSDSDYNNLTARQTIKSFYSPVSEYVISLGSYYSHFIRPLIIYEDTVVRDIKELNLNDPLVTFESEDENICVILADGGILPVASGECYVRVSHRQGPSYRVKIRIIQ
ncbi:MAG: hypothetical protein K5931_05165 [Lachnospiraceae bacterium]|nr:hypothetical protein [Lachnospiraceae bacterium]